MSRMILSGAILLAIAAVPAQAQERCKPVQFARGASSITITGTAPPEDPTCYSFGAVAGMTANLKVTGRNMIMSVSDVGDARDAWTFKTKAQMYKVSVGQMFRSVTNEPYTLTISIQ